MKELPEELTPKLLGLVLGEEVVSFEQVKANYIEVSFGLAKEWHNLDTLIRLILQYIESKGYVFNLFNSTSIQGYVMVVNDHKVIAPTMFEVVLKQLIFITNSKHSLNEIKD